VTQLVVITGPIASGKSTLAAALWSLLSQRGFSAAITDLDDVVFSHNDGFDDAPWTRGRAVHGELVAAWLRSGVDVVLVHGPFYTPEEIAPLLTPLPAGVTPRWVLLLVGYDLALERVTADLTRAGSRNPDFLRYTHTRFAELLPGLPDAEWTFDTAVTPVDEIAAAIADSL
jgi:chloramphenicol 3-O-phosphotransferase